MINANCIMYSHYCCLYTTRGFVTNNMLYSLWSGSWLPR